APEPGPEFLRVADRAPDPIEGCAEEDLFFDAIGAAGHAQPPGCVCGSAAGTGTQPDGCLCRLAPRNGLGPLDRTAQLVPAQLPISPAGVEDRQHLERQQRAREQVAAHWS